MGKIILAELHILKKSYLHFISITVNMIQHNLSQNNRLSMYPKWFSTKYLQVKQYIKARKFWHIIYLDKIMLHFQICME